MIGRPPGSTLFPYTPLFRSQVDRAPARGGLDAARRPPPVGQVDGELPVVGLVAAVRHAAGPLAGDRKSTRLKSSHANISYAVFWLKKKIKYYTIPSSLNHTH